MRNFIAVALSLLLLVSATAAQGNNNIAGVAVIETMTSQVISGASSAQMANIDANIAGNMNTEIQGMNLTAVGNTLTGPNDGKTFLLQSGDIMLDDTGSSNINWQFEFVSANTNQVATGNISQLAAEIADVKGNDNKVFQINDQSAGYRDIHRSTVVADGGSATITSIPFPGSPLSSPNILTGSELKQLSVFDVSVAGNMNTAEQLSTQGAFDNTMTDSRLWQQNIANADILGNDNTGAASLIGFGGFLIIIPNNLPSPPRLPSIQRSGQLADGNTLTKSLANQLVCQDETISGDTNVVGQTGVESMTLDTLTNAGVLQKINEDMDSAGNTNNLIHDVRLTSTANTVTGGSILQQADVFSSS